MITDQNVKAGVLCWLTRHEPWAFMQNFAAQLLHGKFFVEIIFSLLNLAGLDITIDEIVVPLKRVLRISSAICYNGKKASNWPYFKHCAIRVTSLRSGRSWFIDITTRSTDSNKPSGHLKNIWKRARPASAEYLPLGKAVSRAQQRHYRITDQVLSSSSHSMRQVVWLTPSRNGSAPSV